MSHWFFLSYSRSNNSVFVKRFYEDLVAQLRGYENIPASVPDDEIGFYDKESIGLGAQWPPALENALRETRSVVCLYSKGFFQSEVCGKEFQAFRSRLLAWEQANPGLPVPALLLPVRWMPGGTLPEIPAAAAPFQFTTGIDDAVYLSRGLEYMQGQQKHADEYKQFIADLALALGAAARGNPDPLAPHRFVTALSDTNNAFAATPTAVPNAGAAKTGGPKVLQFAYFAGADSDYTAIRQNRSGYPPPPPDARIWKPFAPGEAREVREIAQQLVVHYKWTYEDLAIGGNFVKTIEEASKFNRIVILIIDPWSTRVATLRATIAAWERGYLRNCGVIVPWDLADTETAQEEDLLRQEFATTFAVNPYFLRNARSVKEFEEQLIEAVEQVRQKLLRDGDLRRAGDASVPLKSIDATRS